MKRALISCAAFALLFCSCGSGQQETFQTDYFKIAVDSRGYIVGMWNNTKTDRNFSPSDQPSPLLALYNSQLKRYYYPQKARYSQGRYTLEYENGAVATVQLEEKDKYLKMKLISLENREGIDAIQWGTYYTNIDNLLGDVIGVARDLSLIHI